MRSATPGEASPAGTTRQVLWLVTRPLASKTLRCWTTAESVIVWSAASWVADAGPALRRSTMPRRAVIETSLRDRGAFILVRDLEEAVTIANRVAPEHLELALADPDPWVEKIHHAGAIFIGHYTSESLGDYCAGPNHVLPTSGSARFSSPLGVYDFQKRPSPTAKACPRMPGRPSSAWSPDVV